MKKAILYIFMLVLLALSFVACIGPTTPPEPIDPATCTHTFGEWSPLVPATCEQDGTEKRTCTLCHTEEERVAPAYEHEFSTEFFSDGEIHFNLCTHELCTARRNEREHTYAPSNRCYDCGHRRESDDPTYTFAPVPGGYAVVGYNGDEEILSLPSEYEGEPVVAIGTDAFAACREIIRVNLPRCVERVGKNAFAGCSALSGISFGFNSNLMEIDSYAFADCKKLSVFTVQSKVNYIGAHAFAGCSSLGSITFVTNTGWYVDGQAINLRNDAANAVYLTAEYVSGSFCHN